MKTMKISLIILLTGIVLSSSATNIGDPTTKKDKLYRQIGRLVDYPVSTESINNNSVTVEFTLDEKGQIVVTDIAGKPELTSYVKARLESFVTRKMKELTGEKLYYRFIFRK